MKRSASISRTTFVLLLLLAAAFILPVMYINIALFSVLDEAQRTGTMLSDVRPAFNKALADGILAVIVIATGFMFATLAILLRRVVLPVRRLQDAFHELTAGNFRASVPEDEGAAELQHIAEDFNDAVASVREKTESLAAATAELRGVNERLEKEYAEAKKLNDLVVNRELVMVKMKEEMARLKKALGGEKG